MSAVAVKTFPEPTTVGELMNYFEGYQYSAEYVDIMKESFELQLMEAMLVSNAYIQENTNTIFDRSLYFAESGNVDEDFFMIVESKQQGLLARVWEQIKRFFRWIKNAFARLFGTKTKVQIDISKLDLGDDTLGREVAQLLEDLQNSVFRVSKSDGKGTIGFKAAGGDRAQVIKRAAEFVNEGKIELYLPTWDYSISTKGNPMPGIKSGFSKINTALTKKPKGWEKQVKNAAEDVVKLLENLGQEITTRPHTLSLSDAEKRMAEVESWVDIDTKKLVDVKLGKGPDTVTDSKGRTATKKGTAVDPAKNEKLLEDSPELGAAVAALNTINGKWAALNKDQLAVYNEVIKFQKKAADLLKRYEQATGTERSTRTKPLPA